MQPAPALRQVGSPLPQLAHLNVDRGEIHRAQPARRRHRQIRQLLRVKIPVRLGHICVDRHRIGSCHQSLLQRHVFEDFRP